ncbi:MAG: hypothetical protein H0X45_11030 [Planctomycetes bacterium]|nr:hypothetical protein [Planctomycetota bacterium]
MRYAPTACIAALAVAALAGCASQNERLYYQTRYLPTGGNDAVYSSHERSRWTGDTEIYELPSAPPGLDEHIVRSECRMPGARFKPQTIAGMRDGGDDQPGSGGIDEAGDFDSRPRIVGSLGPDYVLPISAQGDETHGPGLVDRPGYPNGDWDRRPRSRTGAGMDTLRGEKHGAYKPQEKWDYCLDPLPAPTR